MELSSLLDLSLVMNNVDGEPAWGTVVLTGFVLVFGVLVLLYLLISLEGVIFKALDERKKGGKGGSAIAAAKAAPAPAAASAAAPKIEAGIPGEVVAAIVAAISCMEGGSGYVLRSLKRANTGRSAWSQAGVASYTEPF
jgi:apolipoprotein N-acyltransferase